MKYKVRRNMSFDVYVGLSRNTGRVSFFYIIAEISGQLRYVPRVGVGIIKCRKRLPNSVIDYLYNAYSEPSTYNRIDDTAYSCPTIICYHYEV